MTFLTPEETKLTADSRGRVRVSAERRNALLAEFDQSSLSARAFARLMGINEGTFSGWDLRRRKRAAAMSHSAGGEAAAAPRPIQLFEAIVSQPEPEARGWKAALVVELAGGARVEVASPAQLPLVAELVRLVAAAVGARAGGVASC